MSIFWYAGLALITLVLLRKLYNWVIDYLFGPMDWLDRPNNYGYVPPAPVALDSVFKAMPAAKPIQPVSQPWFGKGKTIESYLVDANNKLSEIYVAANAASETIQGNRSYSLVGTEAEPVKLVRSGSGFRVYNHPTVQEGKWLSCR